MQPQPAFVQGQHPRRNASLVASYRPEDPTVDFDATYTQNVRQGDMLLANAMVHAPVHNEGRGARSPSEVRLGREIWCLAALFVLTLTLTGVLAGIKTK